MQPRFNLIEEKWLPCLMMEDNQPCEKSLREVFAEAPAIRELVAASPLVTVALHRLLLVILHRALKGPRNKNEWRALWNAERFDERVMKYLEDNRDSFYLFHETRPFYQVPQNVFRKPDKKPIQLLAHELSSGNNSSWFDHNVDNKAAEITMAEAACYLIAMQGFGLSGGPQDELFERADAPLARSYMILARGESLFETLLLNLVDYNHVYPFKLADEEALEKDKPIWEQSKEERHDPKKSGNTAFGYLDYLTWQSRRIHLHEEADGLWSQLDQNLKYKMGAHLDPFKCYRINDKPKKKGKSENESGDDGESSPYQAFGIHVSRAMWRDCHTLFQKAEWSDKKVIRPEIFEHLAQISSVTRKKNYRFDLYGMASKSGQAAVYLWRHERLPLPVEYLEDRGLWRELNASITFAEKVNDILRQSVRLLAVFINVPNWHLLYPDWRIRIRDSKAQKDAENEYDERRPHRKCKDDVDSLFSSFQHELRYWTRLGAEFPLHLVHLANDRVYSEAEILNIWGRRTQPEWADTVKHAAHTVFDEIVIGIGTSGRGLRAAALAGQHLTRKLHWKVEKFKSAYPAVNQTQEETLI